MENDSIKTMIETDEDGQLLASFFDDNPIIVPDDDFTERVMRRLPARSQRLARIWTWLCIIAGAVFLVLSKAWITIYQLLQNMLLGINFDQITHINIVPYVAALTIISLLMGYSLAKEST